MENIGTFSVKFVVFKNINHRSKRIFSNDK